MRAKKHPPRWKVNPGIDDDIRFSQNMDYYPVDLFNINRKSRDKIVNNFSRWLFIIIFVSRTGCTYFKCEKWGKI